jgi:putative hydrolase of the HAD superfamily
MFNSSNKEVWSSSVGIIFDGDDTLWETMPFYTEAKCEFREEMERLGFDPDQASRAFEFLDKSNVVKYGFSKHRFSYSMTETYRSLCEQFHIEPERNIEERLKDIGYRVFTKRPILLEHTKRVLAQLHPNYFMILATKGDYEVQQSRIEESGIAEYFHKIYILDHKTDRELKQITTECGLDISRSWAIGNSLKSDINPALKIGLKVIWIPYNTWSYEEDVQIESSRLYKVDSLDQILTILT